MKTCPRCKEEKDIDDFGKNKVKKDGLRIYCKLCVKQINKEYYKNTPEKNPARLAYSKKCILRNRKFIFELLQQSKCIVCGNDDWRVLEFDHVRGKKKANVSDLIKRGCSLEVVIEEIKKCDIKCANCHRIKTFVEQKWYIDLIK